MGSVNEEWRDIPGFEGAYQVSDLGRVRSLGRWVQYRDGRRPRFFAGQLRKFQTLNHGHLVVSLFEKKKHLVHRLVMLAFVGPCPPGQEVRHLNGDPTDNRLVNLQYGTRAENQRDIFRHGSRALAPEQVAEIRVKLGRVSQHTLAREYGVSRSTIAHIAGGRLYSYA